MRPRPALFAIILSGLATTSGRSAPSVAIETHVLLKVEAMTLESGRAKSTGSPREAEIGPTQPAKLEFSVPWGASGEPLSVRFEARLTSVVPDGDAVIICESTVDRSGQSSVRASREIHLSEEGSGLFEVFGEGDRRLLLTLRGEKVPRAIVRPPAAVGAPVKFVVAVERVDGERVVLLETNELNTFVGQSVEYSFRQGQGDGLEVVRLVLLPSSTSGDVVTIDADLSCALPGAGGTALVSRREKIVASRGTSSVVSATTGTPPAGYRFQVTPDF